MDGEPGIWSEDELRRHAEWLRSLAHALVGDAATADDVAQDAWVVRGGRELPRDEVRPFLTGVVRRLASQWRRSRTRREARERDAARPESVPSSDELLERVETHELLLEALKALPESYRDALLLRHFEGLEIDQIARRTGAPAGTVRSRLSRGLAELRARLDRSHPKGRHGWTLALLPMARPRHVAAAGAGAVGVLATMGTKGLLACAVLALGLVGWWTASGEASLPEAASANGPAEAPAPGPAPDVAHGRESRASVERSTPPSAAIAATPPPGPEYRVIGRVLGSNLAPLAGARVHAGTGTVVTSASDGTFELTLRDALATRPWPLTVEAQAHRQWMRPFDPGSSTTLWIGDIELEGAGSLVGQVVDLAGTPVPGARVLARRGTARQQPDDLEILASDLACSDSGGRFTFGSLAVGEWTLLVSSHERPWSQGAHVEIHAGVEASVTLRAADVDPSRCIAGTVLDSAGKPIHGVQIQLRCVEPSEDAPRIALSDGDGRFEFHLPTADGIHRLTASEHERFDSIELEGVRPGQTELELVFAETAWLRVRVADGTGSPVRAASVHAADLSRALLAGCEGRSDELGACELRRPGVPFHVFAVAAGFAPRLVGPFEPGSEPVEVLVQLERAIGVRGRVVRGSEPVVDAEVALFAALAPGASRVVRHWPPEVERFSELRELPPAGVTRSSSDGSFALSLPQSSRRAPHGWYVIARRPGQAHAVLGPLYPDLRAGLDGVELQLPRGGSLEGRVRSGSDDPAGLVVWARDGLGGDARGFVGPDGQFRLGPLAAGRWQVRVASVAEWSLLLTSPAEFGDEWGGQLRDVEHPPGFPVRIQDGETTWLELDAPHGPRWSLHGELAVAAVPKGGWAVRLIDESLQRDYEQGEDRWLDSEGQFAIRLAGAGPWRLVLSSRDPRWGRLQLSDLLRPEGPEVHWRGELEFARIRGRSLAGKRAWACSGRSASGLEWTTSLEFGADASFEDVWLPAGRAAFRPASGSPDEALVELDLRPGEHRALELP